MDLQLIKFLLLISIGGAVWKSAPIFVLWWRAKRAGARLGMLKVWILYFRNLPVETILDAHVVANRAGIAIDMSEMVEHLQAGGDLLAVVRAYVETVREGTEIAFSRVCELELELEE